MIATAVKSENRFDNAVPDPLLAGDITMVLIPQQLMPGERAEIRFAAPTLTAITFSVKIAVLGEDVAAGVHYRVVDSGGDLMSAEDGWRLSARGQLDATGLCRSLEQHRDSGIAPVCSAAGIHAGDSVTEYGRDPVAAAGRTADRAVACCPDLGIRRLVTVMGGATRLLIEAPEPIALFAELSVDATWGSAVRRCDAAAAGPGLRCRCSGLDSDIGTRDHRRHAHCHCSGEDCR